MKKTATGLAAFLCCQAPLISSLAAEGVHYVCDDKTQLTATFHTSPGSADLVFKASPEKLSLPQVMSADGGRYAFGSTEFWIKGTAATLTRGGNSTICKH